MADELTQADRDMLTITEAAAVGFLVPGVWENFMDKWTADINGRVNEYFARTEGGSPGESSGGVTNLDAAAPSSEDATPVE